MPYEPNRYPAPTRAVDPGLRDLLTFLRDTFRDAATRIDRYLGDGAPQRAPQERFDRFPQREQQAPVRAERFDRNDRGDRYDRAPARDARDAPQGPSEAGIRYPLESLREEARRISNEASQMDPASLRLKIEAVTAETRALQNRATDPEDQDIAAKILRALTAIVSEHRPGHVYGLARHHQADWDEIGRRARREIAEGAPGDAEPEHE